jgi:hypothetical protein
VHGQRCLAVGSPDLFLGAKLYLGAYAQRLGTTGHFFRRRCDPFLLPHAQGKSGIFLVAVEIAPSATVSDGIVRLEIGAPCRYLAGGGCVQSVSMKTRQRGSSMGAYVVGTPGASGLLRKLPMAAASVS